MKIRAAFLAALTTALLVTAAWAADPLPAAKPEQVGLSSSRLERVGQSFKAQIEQRFDRALFRHAVYQAIVD